MTGPTLNGTRPCNALLYAIAGLFAVGIVCVTGLSLVPGDHSVAVGSITTIMLMGAGFLLNHFKTDKVEKKADGLEQKMTGIDQNAAQASRKAGEAATAAQVVAVTNAEATGARDVLLRYNTAKTEEAVQVGQQNVEAIQSVKAGCDGNFAQVLEKLLASEHANARLHELLGERKEAAKSEALADAGRRRSEREEG
jgi:hypothetical protein